MTASVDFKKLGRKSSPYFEGVSEDIRWQRAFNDGVKAALEASAKLAERKGETPDCERLSGMDPETGAYECSRSNNGGDCLCAERQETADAIAAAIRGVIPAEAP